jgi:hypothetical protein
LRQDFIDWALGDSGSTCWCEAFPIGVGHKNHSCNDSEDSRMALLTLLIPS